MGGQTFVMHQSQNPGSMSSNGTQMVYSFIPKYIYHLVACLRSQHIHLDRLGHL